MKKYTGLNNILFFIGAGYLAMTAVPSFLNSLKQEGQEIKVQEYVNLALTGGEEKIIFPSEKRDIVIFWATWCAPCKLEMARLSNSVKEGNIPIGSIVAINPFESNSKVRSFVQEHPYPFTFIEDLGVSKKLRVNSTPTTLFIEHGKVKSMSSGLSFIGIWKAEYFL
jgi:cytochrome c biogenesis protein CcmG/thiol:disulfide interchange protein DsbE